MFQFTSNILLEFRKCFKREEAWQWFVVAVLGFMVRKNFSGVTQIISSLRLDPGKYHCLLNFFRSKAFAVTSLYQRWIQVAQAEARFMRIGGRTVVLGDHIKVSKEGRRMPGIQILHQESQNSGKGTYIEGHIHAQVSAIVSNGEVSRSMPLMTERQTSPPRKGRKGTPEGDSLITQMINLVIKAVQNIANTAIVVALDAYFAKASAFDAAEKCVDENGKRRLTIVTRGRDDTVGYGEPLPKPKGKRGPNPKYGEKISLRKLFKNIILFTSATLTLYGKPAKVRYRCLDLTWKPVKRIIRFVLVESPLGNTILMCNDLTMQPEDIITTYALRFKIETSFDEQKNHNGGFAYRFWSKYLDKRKRWAKNSQPQTVRSHEHIKAADNAIDVYLCASTIAAGILVIIAFSYNQAVWKRYVGWIRTLRSNIPSLSITKDVFAQDFPAFLQRFPNSPISSCVSSKLRSHDFLFDDVA